MRYRTNLRRVILGAFSLKIVYLLGTILGFGNYFLPIAAFFLPHPIPTLFGERMSLIWLSLMVLLIVSIMPDIASGSAKSEQAYIGTLLLSGIFAYRITDRTTAIFIYTAGAVILSATIWIWIFKNNHWKAIGKASNYTAGWNDVVTANPGEVTHVIVHFGEFEGLFNDQTGWYMRHCHMLEHEDHDMMRPFRVLSESDGNINEDDESSDLPATNVQ